MGSKPFTLNREDLERIGIGLAVAVSGAAITYLAEWVASTDFGSATPIVVALSGVLVNAARKWIKDNSQ